MFKELDEALNWLYTRKRTSRRENLDHIKEALILLGSPEKSFKSIHIAGTNGKGSTSSYIYNILLKSNIRVGLFVSPHIKSFNERISFMGSEISDEELLEKINFLADFNKDFMKTHDSLAFFELTTLMSFLYFKEKKAEIVVFECGLGGRLDATNVLTPLVSIITSIGKDHTEILGKTYKAIAREKLGIVKENVPIVTAEDREELMIVFKNYSKHFNAPLYLVRNYRVKKMDLTGTYFTYKRIKYETPLIGSVQAKCASMAIETINILNSIYNYNILLTNIRGGLKSTRIPCRFEVFKDGNLILDGAHNEDALNESFKIIERISNKKVISIFGCMHDKDYKTMVKILDSHASKIYFTKCDYDRAIDPKELINLSQIKDKILCNNIEAALKKALKSLKKDEIILINGSFYLTSEAREILVKEKGNA